MDPKTTLAWEYVISRDPSVKERWASVHPAVQKLTVADVCKIPVNEFLSIFDTPEQKGAALALWHSVRDSAGTLV
jgi:hypothetical protein